MSVQTNHNRPVTVVGAGFSGLVTSFYLVRAGFKVRVVESQKTAGGLIQTNNEPFGLAETAANAVLNSVTIEDLFSTIGLEIQPTMQASKKRFIFREGVPKRWPFSLSASFRLLLFFLRFMFSRKSLAPKPFESVRTWGSRVIGAEATAYGLEAALQGIYAGDPGRMSVSLIFGKYFRKRKKTKAPAIRGSISARRGMGELIEKLRAYLESRGVEFAFGTDFELTHRPQTPIVLATSARSAAKILRMLDPEKASALDRVELLPIISATVFYDAPVSRAQGFGCLFPPNANRPVLGVLMNSFIFPERAQKSFSETWILGGASKFAPSVLPLSDQELLNLIDQQRQECFETKSQRLHARVTRWPAALPHYTCDLEKLLPSILNERQNVFLICNYLGEIGLSRIIESAKEVAKHVGDEGKWEPIT